MWGQCVHPRRLAQAACNRIHFALARSRRRTIMLSKLSQCGRAVISAAVVSLCLAAPAFAQADQQKLVEQAQATLDNFLSDPDMSWLQKNFSRAKGVLIAPEVVKAGFIIGGS